MDNKYIMAEDIDFELDEFNKVTYIGNNEGIEYIDITNFVAENKLKCLSKMFLNNTSNQIKGVKNNYKDITDLEGCFQLFIGTSLNLSEFKTDNVISFNNTFFCSEIEELNLSNLNTKNGKQFAYMFANSNIKELDLSNFNTENGEEFRFMFSDSNIKELDLSNFNIENGKNFTAMFNNAETTKVDLSSFLFKNQKININHMFENFKCDELIIPNSFPINFESGIFYDSEIKVIKTPNKEFYNKHKRMFKIKYDTELILTT